MISAINNFLVKNVPFIKSFYKKYRISKKREEFDGLTNEEVFTKIYEDNKWDTNKEANDIYYSGTGTYGEKAEKYVDYISNFITEKKISSITDIGCGDFAIGNLITSKNPDIKYNGCDVVKGLIERNKEKFQTNNISFYHIDASNNELPKADLITIRQVLQHLSNKDILNILPKIKQFKYAIITEHLLKEGLEKSYNQDKVAGPDIRLIEGSGVYINKPPFNLVAKEVLRCREDAYNQEAYIVTYLIENI